LKAVKEKPFHGRVALVTGASGGIGRALALRLATEGAVVAIGYSASIEQAKTVVSAIAVEGGKAVAFHADLCRAEAPGETRGGCRYDASRTSPDSSICCRSQSAWNGICQRNPAYRWSCAPLADFLRCSLLTYRFRYARRSRLEISQLTDGGMPPTYDSMH